MHCKEKICPRSHRIDLLPRLVTNTPEFLLWHHPRLVPLSSSSSKVTAGFPPATLLLCILLPGTPSRTGKVAACLSHPCFYNPIPLWEDLWSNKFMACPPPRAWRAGCVVKRKGRTASIPMLKTHYGHEVLSVYCYAG